MVTIAIPDGVTVVDSKNGEITVKGAAGEVKRLFPAIVSISSTGSAIEVSGDNGAMVGTTAAHLKNMIKGAKDGYKIKMKIIYAHFPITVEVKGREIIVKNFLGEKVARRAKIISNTKVEAKGQEIFISGTDKDAVGATISNLKLATKIKKRDSRVFQDGLYIVE